MDEQANVHIDRAAAGQILDLAFDEVIIVNSQFIEVELAGP